MVEPIGHYAQGKRLGLGQCLFTTPAIGHSTWQLHDFGKPPTVCLLLNLDSKNHRCVTRGTILSHRGRLRQPWLHLDSMTSVDEGG